MKWCGKFKRRGKNGIISRYEYDYHSEVYQLIRDGVSDMHCMSDEYLAEEMEQEYAEKVCRILK